jgi:hypothetical protein
MESLDELSKSSNGKGGFIKHVFNFDEASKSEMLNIVQYGVLALIPVVLFNKLMQRFIPEADDEKSSIEITGEILAQVIIMFLVILIIHRLITFIPTYSGELYADFSVTNIILAMLVIVLSLQTKLGEKVSILSDRVIELWEGPADAKKGKGKGNVKVSQPISQNQGAINQMQMNQGAMNQSLNSMGSTSISSLPPVQTQQLPDYNQMYQQDNTPLVGAATPGGGIDSFEPMAANSVGGGAFGSAFGGSW